MGRRERRSNIRLAGEAGIRQEEPVDLGTEAAEAEAAAVAVAEAATAAVAAAVPEAAAVPAAAVPVAGAEAAADPDPAEEEPTTGGVVVTPRGYYKGRGRPW